MTDPGGRRTQAIRAPGGSVYTPVSVAAANPCLNCGTNVQLEYCPECGQRSVEADPTLRELLQELAEEFLHWDGKLATTFRALVTKPGLLTSEFLAGRRVRYLSPLRVYLTCSVLFFFLDALTPARVVTNRDGTKVTSGVIQISGSTEAELASTQREADASGPVMKVFLRQLAKALRSPEELQQRASAAIPKAMFVLVPLFAAMVGLVYRDRRRRYPQHLAFALHVHAALFLMLAVALGNRLLPTAAAAAYETILFAGFVVYLLRATRAIYFGGVAQTIWRLSLASALYFGAFLIVLLGVLAATVLTY